MVRLKKILRTLFLKFGKLLIPELYILEEIKKERETQVVSSTLEEPVKLYAPCKITNCKIGRYSYVSEGAKISFTDIGRFCSIGPGLLCGWGIHPLNGVSTSPMFYSSLNQNGFSLSEIDKILEVYNCQTIKNRLKNIYDFIKYDVDGDWLDRIDIIRTVLVNDVMSEYALEIRYGKENVGIIKKG